MGDPTALIVIVYLIVGYYIMHRATDVNGEFVQGYLRGDWSGTAVVLLSLFTVVFWPYVMWLAILYYYSQPHK